MLYTSKQISFCYALDSQKCSAHETSLSRHSDQSHPGSKLILGHCLANISHPLEQHYVNNIFYTLGQCWANRLPATFKSTLSVWKKQWQVCYVWFFTIIGPVLAQCCKARANIPTQKQMLDQHRFPTWKSSAHACYLLL